MPEDIEKELAPEKDPKEKDPVSDIPEENSTAPVSAGEDNTEGKPVDPEDEIPEDEKEASAEALPDVVRRYELRKIYSKLHSIETFLYNNNSFDIEIIKLQKDVSKAIELFNYMIDNLTAYKDNIDNLIVIFNNFIRKVFELLQKYSKKSKNKEEE